MHPKIGLHLPSRLVESLFFVFEDLVLLLSVLSQESVLRLLEVLLGHFVLVNVLVELEKRLLGGLRVDVLVGAHEVSLMR